MAHQVKKASDGLEVKVSGVQGNEQQMLDAFQECQQGRCSCPTQEYRKLAGMQVEQNDDGSISLHLKAKEGEDFDASEIERCLEYTEERVKSGR